MSDFWRKFGEFILGKAPDGSEHVQADAPVRTPPEGIPTPVSNETPDEYIEKLTHLVSQQEAIRRVESIMFDDSMDIDIRKEALNEYVDLTGWYRPDNADAWSNEEWQKWQEIYESEPEVF